MYPTGSLLHKIKLVHVYTVNHENVTFYF